MTEVLEKSDDRPRALTYGERLHTLFGTPQDIEWSFRAGELFLLQSRPITTL